MPFSGQRFHLGIEGQIASSSDGDWFKIGTLQPGDVLTVSMSGSPSSRGSLSDAEFDLYRGSAGSPTLVTSGGDIGPGDDALVHRFAITAADTYYIRADNFTTETGTYDLGFDLEVAGTPPQTGGNAKSSSPPTSILYRL